MNEIPSESMIGLQEPSSDSKHDDSVARQHLGPWRWRLESGWARRTRRRAGPGQGPRGWIDGQELAAIPLFLSPPQRVT